jgi:hypothetical protein
MLMRGSVGGLLIAIVDPGRLPTGMARTLS